MRGRNSIFKLRKLIVIGLIFLFFSQSLTAQFHQESQELGLCKDLLPLACSPTDLDDGVGGSTRSGGSPVLSVSAHSEVRRQTAVRFKQHLQQNRFEYALSAQALGLDSLEECQWSFERETPPEDCLAKVANGLSRLASAYVIEDRPTEGHLSFAAMDSLLKRPFFRREVQQIQDSIDQLIGRTPAEESLPQVYKWVEDQAVRMVDRWPLDAKTKTLLKTRLRAAEFAGTDCSDIADNPRLPAAFTSNALFYSFSGEIKYCEGKLKGFSSTQSLFSIIFAFAHEMAHGIDPCFITHSPVSDFNLPVLAAEGFDELAKQFYLAGTLQCLIHQRDSVVSQQEPFVGGRGVHPIRIGSKGSNRRGDSPEIESSDEDVGFNTSEPLVESFCLSPQHNEIFCDWFGAEILAAFLEEKPEIAGMKTGDLNQDQIRKGIANSVRPLCTSLGGHNPEEDKKVLFDLSNHPPLSFRANRILLMNPKIREQMGCRSMHTPLGDYCDPNVQTGNAGETSRQLPNPSEAEAEQ